MECEWWNPLDADLEGLEVQNSMKAVWMGVQEGKDDLDAVLDSVPFLSLFLLFGSEWNASVCFVKLPFVLSFICSFWVKYTISP